MANPNIVNVTDILGKTSTFLVTTTNATLVVNNPVNSNKIYKINSIIVANVDASNAADVTIRLYSQDDIGGTATAIVNTITVPIKSSLVVIDKATSIYVLEDKSIGIQASAANRLVVTASWEEIS